MCSADSFAEVMAPPALTGIRLVAATLPERAAAPPPHNYGMENYARLTSELAREVGADVVVGFSMGASVALEMIVSRELDTCEELEQRAVDGVRRLLLHPVPGARD